MGNDEFLNINRVYPIFDIQIKESFLCCEIFYIVTKHVSSSPKGLEKTGNVVLLQYNRNSLKYASKAKKKSLLQFDFSQAKSCLCEFRHIERSTPRIHACLFWYFVLKYVKSKGFICFVYEIGLY